MKCKWCGFESENIEDFEEDFNNYKGFWCGLCDGFTYYEGKEDDQNNIIYLEDAALTESELIKQVVDRKFNRRLSPLRYPGGKSKLIPLIACQVNIKKSTFVETHCGGASVSLALLERGLVDNIVLNDLDYGIYSLFITICNNHTALIDKIKAYIPSRESFFEYRFYLVNDSRRLSMEETAFAALIVNRLAFSGIFKANPKSNLTDRYNPSTLIKRIQWIHSKRGSITVLNENALSVIEEYYWREDCTLFIDPPYYKKGESLYVIYYKDSQHIELANLINEFIYSYPGCADIIITYDNEEFIKSLYPLTKQLVIARKFSISK